ncbi:hypothetical protein AGOR_G00175270 [Albula goreensis]|uniref:Uncharacterized protein n=1 Tax=Albula goreensis TaxID=1534307 RepID=A0A8T3CZC9_9TELE|nr:hypothetical protein AGOR_G00175270 [Albula goreensis]
MGKFSGAPKITHALAGRRRNPGTRYIQDKLKEVKGLERSCILGRSTCSSFMSTDEPKMTRLGTGLNIPDIDVCGRHFLFDKKCSNEGRTDLKYFREKRLPKPNSFIPPLPQDYQGHSSNQINRFTLEKELSHSPSKPFDLGSYERYDLTSVPAIMIPLTAQSLGGKPVFSADVQINRPRVNNQTYGPFQNSQNKKSSTYIDPVCGASASFVQRLSEMASLEGETMRHENLKKLKKTKRLES